MRTPNLSESTAVTLGPILVAFQASRQAEAEDALREARARAVATDAPLEALLLGDDAAHESIIDRATELGASLIVIGPGAGLLAVTSLAGRVIRHSPCPVLIARGAPAGGPVIVGTDMSDPSFPALRAAHAEARRLDRPMVGVHVVDVSPTPAIGLDPLGFGHAYDPHEAAEQMLETARARLEEVLQGLAPGAEARVLEGRPGATLIELAESSSAALLVVGTHGRTGLGRLLIGSRAEDVARHAQCSVLVVPQSTASELLVPSRGRAPAHSALTRHAHVSNGSVLEPT